MIWAISQGIRMNDKIRGFILAQNDYKEADVLMQVLTKEYGILSLVARSAKKTSSRNHFLSMCLYEFIIDYKEGKTMYTVHGSKLLSSYFEDKDVEMMSFKNILIELTLKNRDIDTFDELCFVFSHLNRENRYLLGNLYLSYILKQFGIMPHVDSCALCQNRKVVAISARHGGFLCLNHVDTEEILPVDVLKKFRLMVKASFANYDVIRDFVFDFRDFSLLMDFYLINSDQYLKTYEFYKTIC